MFHVLRRLVVIVCIGALGATSAEAAAVRVGPTVVAYVSLARGNAVAYDSIHDVYLVVSAHGSYPGTMYGGFTDKNGTQLGAPFKIQLSGNATHFPRATFAPDGDAGAGAFLVTWHESDLPGGSTSIHGRMVSFAKGGPAGADNMLSADGSWWEAGPAIAYATVSKEFLVTYPRTHGVFGVRAVRVDLSGAALGAPFSIATNGDYEDNPSVAYNPTTNLFLVSYAGFSVPGNYAFVNARLVQAGTGQLLGAGPTLLTATSGTFITDSTYISSTNQYLVAWYNGAASLGRLVAADGTTAGNVTALSTLWKGNDGLSLAYNPLTDTALLVSVSPNSVEDGGVEITRAGVPVDNGFPFTAAGGSGNFYPRLTTSTRDPNWLVSTSHQFTSAMVQLVTGTATYVPPAPNPVMSVDSPGGGVLQQPFVVAGWAADLGSTSGPGVDVIHVWAWPVGGGAPRFLGAVGPSVPRGDVGSIFGAQFTGSGFGLPVSGLTGGTYDVVAYMHSTVAGAFNLARAVRVTVSEPIMSVDTPGPGGVVSGSGFLVAGWALDRGAPAGQGIDAIHVWAVPIAGGGATFLGGAPYGYARPDVAAAYGAQFTYTGYNLWCGLPPGAYYLVVYTHSAVTGTFNNWQVVPIVVQ